MNKPLTKKDVKIAGVYCENEDEEIIPKDNVLSAKQGLKKEMCLTNNFDIYSVCKKGYQCKYCDIIDKWFCIEEEKK